MRLAFIQMNCRFGDKEANLQKAEEMLSRQPADLYVLPELFNSGYFFASREQAAELAEEIPHGQTCDKLAQWAQKHKCFLVAGLAERAGQCIFNSAVLVGPRGYVATYRKVHLFDEEKLWFDAGDRPFAVYDIGVAKVGMMICFDWIFPEAMRSLALLGADIICHPANLVLPFCQAAMTTRCLENGVFAATANRIGRERRGNKTLHFTGGSQITGRKGEILLRAPKSREQVGVVEIDPFLARDKWLTSRNHLFADRRPQNYFLST